MYVHDHRFARWAHRSSQSLLLIIIFFVAQATWPDWIKALETTAWLFTFYMLVRLVIILIQNPRAFTYQIPSSLSVPQRVTVDWLPTLTSRELTREEAATWEVIVTLRGKILSATDEGSVHTLMRERIQNLRSWAFSRFSEVSRELNTLAFEGIIGTLLGMMVFMAQASKLLKLPPMDSGDSSALAAALMKNLQEIDFLVVLTAFITSVIGWTAKAWIGRSIDRRRDEELNSLMKVEAFLQVEILAHLTLPSRAIVAHTLTLQTWAELLRGQVKLRVKHVEGGLLLEPEVAEPKSIFFEDVSGE
ncbi:hypothetical protein HY630_01025 [Candidatus Uhrbacteria bacterium]|nr:hypothetical protein [Candidatus Uhrbacteria bacterium]